MLHKELEGAGQKRKKEKAIEKRKKEAAQWQWRENVIARHPPCRKDVFETTPLLANLSSLRSFSSKFHKHSGSWLN